MKDYRLVVQHQASDLERSVRELCKDGWEPTGGLTVLSRGEVRDYFQPMTKLIEGATFTAPQRAK